MDKVLALALICGAALLAAPASAQSPSDAPARTLPDRPAKQRYLSDVRLHREPAAARMPDRAPVRPRGERPFPGPDVAYEVNRWTDGAVETSAWCYAADPAHRGLGGWTGCGR
jgi:hypothetical protein